MDFDQLNLHIKQIQKRPIAILLSHAHLDHISIANKLQKRYSLDVYLHINDKKLANELSAYCKHFNLEKHSSPQITHYLDKEKKIKILDFYIDVYFTPGHTEGGVCYGLDRMLFVGDTIFKNSIGRTDLPGGDLNKLYNSINSIIFNLDDDIEIYSGHGPKTTIGFEKKNNQFLKNE